MTPKRPHRLKWIGETYPDGRPAQYLDFVPPRDLDEAETDALSQEELAGIRTSGLYREVHAPEPKKTAAKAKPTPDAPASRPDGAERTIGADEPSDTAPAAEPATEGEEQ